MRVFVLDKNLKPLDPCRPARARLLLRRGREKVYRKYPFTIIILDLEEENCVTHKHQLKIDPGAKTTGFAILALWRRLREQNNVVIWGAELTHRGFQIRDALTSRRQLRRGIRNRKTCYIKSRFLNRTRPDSWLPTSLLHRVFTTITWVKNLIIFGSSVLVMLNQHFGKGSREQGLRPLATLRERSRGKRPYSENFAS
ncbi:hypothetical protein BJP34_33810 [Moorena producens PAL-8-15-08-1]|uniref:RRXRR domain-containing protein n=1 Tax=Moorena producens PAL-8-15-08-1 TaxID=1458985 RepID=A0A1D8U1J1_9CYAN|nr:RRXRR domain-containing protein [Moorena producens]AOX03748.1 hypothetical protein BJP34_33810 [Moorena producens PAL-8-15-08-1]